MIESLPPNLASGPLRIWRIDDARFSASAGTGEGSFRAGGRWNPKGYRAVYASFQCATAVLEVAVHKGFLVLDTVPHVLTVFEVAAGAPVYVVRQRDVPNAAWLTPSMPSAGQREFGRQLMERNALVAVPSAVTKYDWNVVFNPERASGFVRQVDQELFSLDTRLT
jgi:RES domain-containing protein